jgi:hypothetical protein
MNMKKKVKCKCSQCGKTFVCTRSEKLFMQYYTAVLCSNCLDRFFNKVMDRVMDYTFGRKKENEREQKND